MRKHLMLSAHSLVCSSQVRVPRSVLLSLTLLLLLGAAPALAHPGAHAVRPKQADTQAAGTEGMDALGTARTFATALANAITE